MYTLRLCNAAAAREPSSLLVLPSNCAPAVSALPASSAFAALTPPELAVLLALHSSGGRAQGLIHALANDAGVLGPMHATRAAAPARETGGGCVRTRALQAWPPGGAAAA
eukprot:scaffold4783_cov373-Prasinococcus_capsulatus_cf.AAC.4